MSVELHHALGDHRTASGDVSALARPARVVRPETSCEVVDEAFRTDPELLCLAVSPRADHDAGGWGLISRGPFMSAMAGRLGYGRSVHARRPVASLTDWDALVLAPTATVSSAAALVLARERAARYSEVLVIGGSETGAHGEVAFIEVEDVLRSLNAELAHKALTDQLTGLSNREHFLHQLQTAGADERRVAVVYVDVDDFKSINDGYGHNAGDLVLQQVAEHVRAAVGPDGVAARLGGDEFALLVRPPLGASTSVRAWADEVAHRLLARLCEPVDVAGRALPGRASVGVAISGPGAVDASVLLHEADLAMYAAKAAGGSRCTVVDGTGAPLAVLAAAPDRTELHAAVAQGQFVLHFQPVVAALTGRLTATEALVRWRHPSRGLLPPAAFLGDVAAAGFAATLDAHVLRLALSQQARWQATHGASAPAHVNVNLSVSGLLDDDLVSLVLRELDREGLAPQVLRLELPEVATTAHIVAASPSLAALRAAGVGLALDDVGTGAAGLAHLSDLHLDSIKIDRRFVSGMLTDDRDAAVVRMLAQMGQALGVAVTAEGAETPEHVRALRELAGAVPRHGLHVQGYAVGRPVPPEELAATWLLERSVSTPPGVHRPAVQQPPGVPPEVVKGPQVSPGGREAAARARSGEVPCARPTAWPR